MLGGIADEADRQALPKNRLSSFHRALDAPIVVNFVEYTESSGGAVTTSVSKQLVARTHEISAHEMRWYDKSDVVAAEGLTDSFEDVLGHGNIGVVGVYTVAPERRSDLLHALRRYADAVRSADGFKAMLILEGDKPEHAASYEIWSDEAAYRRATANTGREALEAVRGAARDAIVHTYDVVRVNRHGGAAHGGIVGDEVAS